VDRTLRLIPTESTPAAELARTIEALLVVASQPLPIEELATAAEVDPSQVEQAIELLGERFAEGRSGIVLEHVAGGWAFRASSAASDACMRLFDKPAEKGLSQAALETLAIIAYLGPVSRPEIARLRPRVARRASARRRPRRRRGADPRAPRIGRREAPGLI
jgi:segregation and condensation protein B